MAQCGTVWATEHTRDLGSEVPSRTLVASWLCIEQDYRAILGFRTQRPQSYVNSMG